MCVVVERKAFDLEGAPLTYINRLDSHKSNCFQTYTHISLPFDKFITVHNFEAIR